MASRREAVAPMVDRILDAVGAAGLSSDELANLSVALSEALANAAVHGNKLRPRSRVGVTVEVEPGVGVAVTVRDSGDGFRRDTVADPSQSERLLFPRGRGVFLMERLVEAAGRRGVRRRRLQVFRTVFRISP